MGSPRIQVTEMYPLELHIIKALLLQRQYRQCITTCREVLNKDDPETTTPLRRTFAQFYLALAHDELARAMHTFSQAKVPAFNQAEQFYHEALTSLPDADACRPPSGRDDEKPISRHDTPSENTSSNSLITSGHSRSQSDTGSIQLSPSTHIRNDSLPLRSPPQASPGHTESEVDDLESHASFEQIMTPTRLPRLERDYSSMSLLQAPNKPSSLMKPIRLGSPAKPYHAPPSRSQTFSSRQTHHPTLPKIDTSSSTTSPVRKQLRTASELASPIDFSPVSPLGSEGATVTSDASTISPISPETPGHLPWTTTPPDPNHEHPDLTSLTAHLQALRTQLHTHIALVREAKQRALDLQTERLAAHLNPAKTSKFGAVINAAGSQPKSLPLSRSYWSFTPKDQAVQDRRQRIQDGRERGWKRQRFDATRYEMLAEAALAEL